MKRSKSQYRKFLEGVVKTRKFLIRTGRSKKGGSAMMSTIMQSEDLLMRRASDATIKSFLQRNYVQIRLMIPAKGSDDKRYQTLDQLVHA